MFIAAFYALHDFHNVWSMDQALFSWNIRLGYKWTGWNGGQWFNTNTENHTIQHAHTQEHTHTYT